MSAEAPSPIFSPRDPRILRPRQGHSRLVRFPPQAVIASLRYTPARRWHETQFPPQQGLLRHSGTASPKGLDPAGATIVSCAGSHLLRVRLTERALCLSDCASDAASVSANVRRNWRSIVRLPHFDCAPLQLERAD